MTLIVIEEHWIMPDLTSALRSMPQQVRDERLAFKEMDDNQQCLEDLGAEPIGLQLLAECSNLRFCVSAGANACVRGWPLVVGGQKVDAVLSS